MKSVFRHCETRMVEAIQNRTRCHSEQAKRVEESAKRRRSFGYAQDDKKAVSVIANPPFVIASRLRRGNPERAVIAGLTRNRQRGWRIECAMTKRLDCFASLAMTELSGYHETVNNWK